jgi:hypothetical protein
METASIVVDFRHMRCGNCKVALSDEFATHCPVCHAKFEGVASNHTGLAEKLRQKRRNAAVSYRAD